MSDEYSLHGRFLMGKDSAAEYERRLARLRRIEAEREEERELGLARRTTQEQPGCSTPPQNSSNGFSA